MIGQHTSTTSSCSGTGSSASAAGSLKPKSWTRAVGFGLLSLGATAISSVPGVAADTIAEVGVECKVASGTVPLKYRAEWDPEDKATPTKAVFWATVANARYNPFLTREVPESELAGWTWTSVELDGKTRDEMNEVMAKKEKGEEMDEADKKFGQKMEELSELFDKHTGGMIVRENTPEEWNNTLKKRLKLVLPKGCERTSHHYYDGPCSERTFWTVCICILIGALLLALVGIGLFCCLSGGSSGADDDSDSSDDYESSEFDHRESK